jgi:hypothetical protein
MLHHIVLFTWNDKVPAGHPAIAANEFILEFNTSLNLAASGDDGICS